MLTICWSPKGGSGTSVVAAGLALAAAATGDTLLVDLDGDQPALLGMSAPTGEGMAEWAGAHDVPADALASLEVPVVESLRLLPRGRGRPDPAGTATALGVLATSRRNVVVDSGPLQLGRGARSPTRHIVVARACYLAALRLRTPPAASWADLVVVVEEPGRALTSRDLAGVIDAPVVATPWDPAVARAVDAGLLATRLPRSLNRLAGAVARVAAS